MDVECRTCGPSKDHDILFKCQECNLDYCEDHINNHSHMSSTAGSYPNPSQQTFNVQNLRINLAQLGRYQPRMAYREPSKAEYEWFLRTNPKVLTSGRESIDLIIGVALIAFVFGFRPILNGDRTWEYVVVLMLIIGPAFILHELAHKYAAIHYGKYARFTLIRTMAYLTFLFGFIGAGIAGPGATMILGKSDKRETGIFAAAGPALNFVLATISLSLIFIFPDTFVSSFDADLHWIFYLAVFVNAFLALFNLIPFSLLDGKKIKDWNFSVWLILVGINLVMLLISAPTVLAETASA